VQFLALHIESTVTLLSVYMTAVLCALLLAVCVSKASSAFTIASCSSVVYGGEFVHRAVPVAVPSKAFVCGGLIRGIVILIPLQAWMFFCCVLYR
jgi:uncharacterized membrane protein YccF (DUF307 family)